MRIGINKKIMGFFGAGVVVFSLFAGLSFFVINDLAKALRNAGDLSKGVHLTGDLQLEMNKLLSPVSQYLLTGDIKERDNFDARIREIYRLFAEVKTYRGDRKWEEASGRVERDAIDFGEKALEILYIDNPVGNREAQRLMTELTSAGGYLIREVDDFHGIAHGDLESITRAINDKVRKAGTYTLVLFGTLLIFVALLHQYLRVSLMEPLLKLHKGVGVIAKGNLGHRLDIRTGDELGKLAEAFNAMTEQIEKTQSALKDLSIHDGLTGLINHLEFMRRLHEELERSRRYGRSCALLMLDLDHFKTVNDTYGHPAEDGVLGEVSARILREIRPTDWAARYGGEEFAVLLPETPGAGALVAAERIRAAIAARPVTMANAPTIVLTVSVGVAAFPEDAANADDLIAAADQALYAAKRAGRNCVCVCPPAKG